MCHVQEQTAASRKAAMKDQADKRKELLAQKGLRKNVNEPTKRERQK